MSLSKILLTTALSISKATWPKTSLCLSKLIFFQSIDFILQAFQSSFNLCVLILNSIYLLRTRYDSTLL